MDIMSLQNVGSAAIQAAENNSAIKLNAGNDESSDLFGSILNSAMDNINLTNAYAQDAKNEKLKLALGETENTHDLKIALEKSSTALQYTIAVRDKFLEAYREIMQMQI